MEQTLNNVGYTAAPEFEIKYAGLWKRFCAQIIDGFTFIPIIIVMSMFGLKVASLDPNPRIANILIGLICPLIVAWIISTFWQASIGKRAVKIFIIDNGHKINFYRAFLRAYLYQFVYLVLSIVISLSPYAVNIDKIVNTPDYVKLEQKLVTQIPQVDEILKKNNLTMQEFLTMSSSRSIQANLEITDVAIKNGVNLSEVNETIKKLKLEESKLYLENYPQIAGIFLLLSLIWYLPIVFTKQKTAMHDIILGTRVIKGKAEDYYNSKLKTEGTL